MWLTDYVPSTSVPIVVRCRLSGVANRQVGPNITVVPTPNCAEEGDWQVVAVAYWTNGTPDWSVTGYGKNVGDWWPANTVAPSEGFVDGPAVYIRKITAGNINSPFTVGIPSGALDIRYITWIMKSEIQDNDPVIACVSSGAQGHNLTSTLNDLPFRRSWLPTSIPVVSEVDLILTTAGGTSPVLLVPPESERVPLAVAGATGSFPPTLACVLQRRSLDIAEDLNGGGLPLAGWTLHNVSSLAGNIAQEFYLQQQAISNARFGIYKDFWLEAGKTYVFSFDEGSVGSSSTGAFGTAVYLGYVDPNSVEHGVGANDSYNSSGIVGTDCTTADFFRGLGADNNGVGGGIRNSALIIRPSITGTHTLWMSILQQQHLATLSTSLYSTTGATSRFFKGCYIRVYEIKDFDYETFGGYWRKRNNSERRDYYWSERLYGINRQGQTSAQNKTGWTVFRGNSNKRPLVRMGGTAMEHNIAASPSPNRTIQNEEQYPFPAQRYLMEHSDQAVGPWIHDKFYFEYKIDAYAPRMGIGVHPSGHFRMEILSQVPATSNTFRHYALMFADGSTWFDNVLTASAVSAAALGDIIGVLIDYTAGTIVFTKNGGAWSSWSMPVDPRRRWHMYSVMGIRQWAGAPDASRYTLNLTGPFAFRPSGAIPFDFDNEANSGTPELFTADGTWTKPDGIAGAYVYVFGGGGGGGSGIVGSYANTYNGGGTGGGGGGYSFSFIPAANLAATEAVTVGQGGAGGAAVGPSNGFLDGNTGVAGGTSSFGAHVSATGGGGGNRGYTGNSNNGVGGAGGTGNVSTGGGGWRMALNGTGASVNGTENGSAAAGPGGGGGGGGCTIVGGFQSYDACIGGDAPVDNVPAAGAAGTNGVPPTAGQTPTAAGPGEAGAGGGGGGSHVTAGGIPTGVSADGANGGLYGGGGGGGGAGVSYGGSNFGTGGAGGNGAGGCVYVIPVY